LVEHVLLMPDHGIAKGLRGRRAKGEKAKSEIPWPPNCAQGGPGSHATDLIASVRLLNS
jgi:hypothetical protein